jgi:hypothetical protein
VVEEPGAALAEGDDAILRTPAAHGQPMTVGDGHPKTGHVSLAPEHPGGDLGAVQAEGDGQLGDADRPRNPESIREKRDPRRLRAEAEAAVARLQEPPAPPVAARAPPGEHLAQQLVDHAAAGRVGLAAALGEQRDAPMAQQRLGELEQAACGERRPRFPGQASQVDPGRQAVVGAGARARGSRGDPRGERREGVAGVRRLGVEQRREQPQADPVAGVAERAVGGIAHRIQVGAVGERAREQPAGGVEQRPEQRMAPAADAGEPAHARALPEAQQQGLELVLAVVGGEDPRRAETKPLALEDPVARGPRGGLEAAGAAPVDLRGARQEVDVEPLGERAGGARAARRVGVERVVDVDRAQVERASSRQPLRRRQQGGRIGASREGDDQPSGRGQLDRVERLAEHPVERGAREDRAACMLGDGGVTGDGVGSRRGAWWRWRDLNPRHSGYEPLALTN